MLFGSTKLGCFAILSLPGAALGPLLAQPAQAPNTWTTGAPMPTARQGPFTGVIGSSIYVISGENASVVTVNEIYDTVTNTWSTGAPIPTARYLGGSAVVNNIIYTMGGLAASGISNVVEAFDPSTDTWSTKSPMPIVADSIKATVENGLIYAVGGYNGTSGRLTSVLSYNPATDTWTTLAPLEVGKSESAVGLLGSTIVSAGGLTNSGATTTDTEGYNAATNFWSTLAPMPTARQAGCFGAIGSMLYVGGGNTGTSVADVVQAYSGATNSWTSSGLPSMPNGVVAPGSASVGGRLYCFGGSNNGLPGEGTVYNYVQIYQPGGTLPAITSGGVVSASAFGEFASASPGSWIEIYGSNLAADTRGWTTADFNGINAPTSLDGTSVTIGGQPAFIDYISPGQVNALVSSNTATGVQQLTVKTGVGTSAVYNITINAVEPGLLATSTFNISGTQYVVAILPDGSYALPSGAIPGAASRPAQPGDIVTLYGVGFGPVAPNTPAGQLAQQQTALTLNSQMSIGGAPASLLYAGLAPGFTGLYQFNVQIPSVAAGNAALTFSVGGTNGTQTLYVAVGN